MRAFLFSLLVLAVLWWWWGLRRAALLFTVTVRNGQVARVRGRVPPRLLAEIEDIIAQASVTNAHFEAKTRDGSPVLHFEGEMDPTTIQQMRNVMGQFTVGQIRNSPKR